MAGSPCYEIMTKNILPFPIKKVNEREKELIDISCRTLSKVRGNCWKTTVFLEVLQVGCYNVTELLTTGN